MTVSWGGGSALSGSECSTCGSMARQLMVQPHFLHFTTQATVSPKFRPAIPAIIGEQKEKVTSAQRTTNPLSAPRSKVRARLRSGSGKLTHHVRPLSPYREGALD